MDAHGGGLSMRGVLRGFRGPSGCVEVLRGIDLDIPSGSFAVVHGPSGSGKSTLLHLAALLDRPDAGRIWLGAREVTALGEGERDLLRREAVGIIFQRFHLLSDRSALENVRLRFRYTGISRAEGLHRSRAALEGVGLGAVADRAARWLSGGEMQRVALARAIALPPRLLLADEPVGQIDARAASEIFDILDRLRTDGVTILAAAHGPLLSRRADFSFTLEAGRMVPARSA